MCEWCSGLDSVPAGFPTTLTSAHLRSQGLHGLLEISNDTSCQRGNGQRFNVERIDTDKLVPMLDEPCETRSEQVQHSLRPSCTGPSLESRCGSRLTRRTWPVRGGIREHDFVRAQAVEQYLPTILVNGKSRKTTEIWIMPRSESRHPVAGED